MQVFFIITVAFCVLYFFLPRKWSWVSFVLLVLALTVMAYYCVPAETDDLARYYNRISQMRGQDISVLHDFIDRGVDGWDATPLAGYYFFFISRFESNSWLPAITIFLVYGIMYFMLYHSAEVYKVNKGYLFLGAMFILTTYWFYDVCSGVRNGMAFAIVLLGAYLYFMVKKSPLVFLIYAGCCVCGCLIHTAATLLVALTLFAVVTQKIGSKYLNWIVLFALPIGGVIISVLSEVSDNTFFQLVAEKSERAMGYGTPVSNTMELVNLSVFIVSALIVYYCYYYFNTYDDSNRIRSFQKFATIVLLFMVGTFNSGLIFVRFARFILPPVIAVVLSVGMQMQKNKMDPGVDLSVFSTLPYSEKLRMKNRLTITLFVGVYLAVHYWYDLYGSSLLFLHFE